MRFRRKSLNPSPEKARRVDASEWLRYACLLDEFQRVSCSAWSFGGSAADWRTVGHFFEVQRLVVVVVGVVLLPEIGDAV